MIQEFIKMFHSFVATAVCFTLSLGKGLLWGTSDQKNKVSNGKMMLEKKSKGGDRGGEKSERKSRTKKSREGERWKEREQEREEREENKGEKSDRRE